MARSCGTRNRRSRNVIAYRPVSLGAAAGLILAAAMTSLGAAPTAYTLSGPAVVHPGGDGAAAYDPSGNDGNGGNGAPGDNGNGGPAAKVAPAAKAAPAARAGQAGRAGAAATAEHPDPAVSPARAARVAPAAHLAEPPASLGSPANPAAETGRVRLERRTHPRAGQPLDRGTPS